MKSINLKIRQIIFDAVKKIDKSLKIEEIHLEHPQEESHGDYASNIAMVLVKKMKKQPMELASLIVKELKNNLTIQPFSHITIASPGFINFWLSKDWLMSQIDAVLQEKDRFGANKIGAGKKIILEHTSPNIIKSLHVGHVRNNILGMAMSRILKLSGYKVVLDCINNDRGIHIMKAVWAFLLYLQQ